MAGAQIPTAVTIINSILGFQAVSLTNMGSNSEPQIAAGSKVEVASAFFTFGSNESITNWAAVTTGNTVYITVVPAGTAGTQTITAAWSDDPPVWNTSKQGYYLSSGSTIRYVGGCHKRTATIYKEKFLLTTPLRYDNVVGYLDKNGTTQSFMRTMQRIYEIGEWNMDADLTNSVGHALDTTTIYEISVMIIGDDAEHYSYAGVDGGHISITSGTVVMTHGSGSYFNTSSFSATASTVANRGFIVLKYWEKEA